MESKIKSSFIPKKPVAQSAPTQSVRRKSSGLDVAMLVSIVFLVIAGVLAAGVFLYQQVSVQDAEDKKAALEKARDDFQPALIKDFMKLSSRIRVAEGILEKHIAPSVFLYALEKDTLSGVQFIEFKFKQKNTETAEFTLKGKTGSVNSVALQSSRFGDSSIIKNSIFSDIDLVKDGVTFKVSGEIDLNAIRFANVVSTTPQQRTNLNSDAQGGGFGRFEQINVQTSGSASATTTLPDIDGDDFGDFGSFE